MDPRPSGRARFRTRNAFPASAQQVGATAFSAVSGRGKERKEREKKKKVANKAGRVSHYYSEHEITHYSRASEQTAPRHLYAAATGDGWGVAEGLSRSAAEQRELEGRATASQLVSVH